MQGGGKKSGQRKKYYKVQVPKIKKIYFSTVPKYLHFATSQGEVERKRKKNSIRRCLRQREPPTQMIQSRRKGKTAGAVSHTLCPWLKAPDGRSGRRGGCEMTR